MLGERDGFVEQRLIRHDARAFDAAACRQDQLRFAVVDAGGEFLGCEAAEHDGMHGADAGAGQHGEHRLRHHRHIEDDGVALAHAEIGQHSAEQLHFRQQAAVGEALHLAGDGGIVDQRRLVIAPGGDVAVERVVAGVATAAGEPAPVNTGMAIEDLLGPLVPVDGRRRLAPEHLRVALPMRIDVVIAARAGVHRRFPSFNQPSPWGAPPGASRRVRHQSRVYPRLANYRRKSAIADLRCFAPSFETALTRLLRMRAKIKFGRDCGTAAMRKQGWRGAHGRALIRRNCGLRLWS